MSSNNDNAMTRFLFAILRQKNLKDIDWNKVAHDPILAQEITNGHAARMRYSRFRSAMLGLEPTKRNRTGPPKSRVTKSKKESKNKKDSSVKSDSAVGSPAATTPEPSQPAPPQRIKQENAQYAYSNRLTPALTPRPAPSAPVAPASISNPAMLQNRFLTPCSDTEPFPPSPIMVSSPTSDLLHSQGSYDYHGPPCHDHVDPIWPHGTSYFTAAYPFEEYTPVSCDHQHMHRPIHPQSHLTLASQTVENDLEQSNVKREEWSRYD